jgi:hypothetical protein
LLKQIPAYSKVCDTNLLRGQINSYCTQGLQCDRTPPSLQKAIAKEGYSHVLEYNLHLILQEQVKAARVETLLLDSLASIESIKITDECWSQKRTQYMAKEL